MVLRFFGTNQVFGLSDVDTLLDLQLARERRSLLPVFKCFESGHGVKTADTPVSVKSDLPGQPCAICGQEEGVTIAHLLKTSEQCTELGLPYDRTNFLPLCGTDGWQTCHHKFDKRFLALKQAQSGNVMDWVVVGGGKAPNGTQLHGKRIHVAQGLSRRVLKAHLVKALLNQSLILDEHSEEGPGKDTI